jgi:glyoxylase-like metal-dependent hydrolase (beta-lactamase superfamily II)/ferredoxin
MAKINRKRSQNISGDFYVDSTCIDCDTCRWMAPETFTRIEKQSAVYHQPETEIERKKALQALLSCPTASIGTVNKPKEINKIETSFPLLIEDNVYHCGYHSQASFAATSYFIKRSQGNILIDSPRFNPSLVKRLELMGGVRYLYLTHKDDIADHQKFQAHFHCDRILHREDITNETQDIEIKLDNREAIEFEQDLVIIPVPGHTKGHTVLLYRDKFLFSGDHLAWSNHLQQLVAFKDFCWYSWDKLVTSMENLTKYHFNWILPGHGRRYNADYHQMKQQLAKCILWMKTQLGK